MRNANVRALRRLVTLRGRFSPSDSEDKLEALKRLGRGTLSSASLLLELHEILCFMRAYPDNGEVLARVEGLLARFGRRADVRRHRGALESSGIAGTEISYRFFLPTAGWLAKHWPDRLDLDWTDEEAMARLRCTLPALASPAEASSMKESRAPTRDLLRRLARKGERDGACFARRIRGVLADDFARESLHDAVDASYRLMPGERPSRTHARHPTGPIVFQARPLIGGRVNLAKAAANAPGSVRALAPKRADEVIDLAREAMVTRSRDLDAFAYGNRNEVTIVDDGDGLAFACIGCVPERRLHLRGAFGLLLLKNGVPIGYAQIDALFRNAALSFHVFETFRGAEASHVLARTMAVARALFGSGCFSIEPYQLGHHNEEAIDSGAWWFYFKLGFRPRDPSILRLAKSEIARIQRSPKHRSSPAVLRQLARGHLFLRLDPKVPLVDPAREDVSVAVSRVLSDRFGADRARAVRESPQAALERLGLRSFGAKNKDERRAVASLSPVLLCLPGLERWPRAERAAVRTIVRAKGRAKERDYIQQFDRHPRLGRAVLGLGGRQRHRQG